MTFLCKTQSEFSSALRRLAMDFMFKNRSADETKSLLHAYLGQNRRHYPKEAAFWTDHFRALFNPNYLETEQVASLTRAAATGN